jgi:hypothetical protein
VKRVLPFSVILLGAAVFSYCSDDPVKTSDDDDDPGSPYSGMFTVVSEQSYNDCAIPEPPAGTISVLIEGDSMLFGGFPGDWDEGSLTGTGDVPEVTVPVIPPSCYAYYTVVYEITYVNADSFSGTYGADYRKDPGCPNADPCSYRYNITGSR